MLHCPPPGPILNLAARIKARAAGGQVLVCSHSWEEMCDSPGYEFEDMGEIDLKGMGELRIFQASKSVRAALPLL